MYQCEKCKRTFEMPKTEKDIHYECQELPFELFGVCPVCGCGRIERTD